MRCFDERDYKERQRKTPDVVRELAAEVVRYQAWSAIVVVGVCGSSGSGSGRRDADAVEVVGAFLELGADKRGAAAPDGGEALDGGLGEVRGWC